MANNVAEKHSRNSTLDKTNPARAEGDPSANPEPVPATPADAGGSAGKGERGTKGAGMPVASGAGQLADDRPGRNMPKGA